MLSRVRARCRPSRGLLLGLVCALCCLGCEELLNAVLFGPELCAEGIVSDVEDNPVSQATVALIWHCDGTECNSFDCSDCAGLGNEHVVTDSTGRYRVTDRVLDGDCSCRQCWWDVLAEAPGYRQVGDEILGSSTCSRCEVRNFTLERVD